MADCVMVAEFWFFCTLSTRQAGLTTKIFRIIGIRYGRMKRPFLPANVWVEKKLRNDIALNSIKGLSTTHC